MEIDDIILKVMDKVLNDEYNAVILDISDLITLINYELPKGHKKIDLDDFREWLDSYESKEEKPEKNPLYERFYELLQIARIRQKQSLILAMTQDPARWQRYAWILERSFDDMNLVQKQKIDQKSEDEYKIIHVERPTEQKQEQEQEEKQNGETEN